MPRDNPITRYWLEHYVNDSHCSLCGNRGVIDTRGVCTPVGLEVGRLNWCICPNGQSLRRQIGGTGPKDDGGEARRLEIARRSRAVRASATPRRVLVRSIS